ncbi:MAG: colicin-e7 immunity protein [Pseudomonas sp.]|nr:colicin-e7 immunity protein [Pseudomonas sp.]
MMKLKKALSDYTEYQFTQVIQLIIDCEGTEEFQTDLIVHLNELAGGAGGSDLIFYPEDGADSSAEGVVRTIQAWCRANSLPGLLPPL